LIKWIALGAIAALVLLFIFFPTVAWILVGLVALLIALILFVPIGADVSYLGGQFRLAARVDGFAIQLIPRKKKEQEKPPEEKPKEEQKPKEPKDEKKEKPKREFNFTKDELLEIVKKALKGLGKFGKLTVRKFMLHWTVAGEDPYDAAVSFNYINAALSVLAPLCAPIFKVTGDVDVRTDLDFTADSMRVDTELSITLRLIQVVRAALAAGIGVLGVLRKRKKRLKEEAKLAEKNGGPEAEETQQPAPAEQEKDQPAEKHDKPEEDEKEQTMTIEQENNQPEERKDDNGD